MTRTEAMTQIAERLQALDDDSVQAVVDFVSAMPAADDLLRALTPRELELIEQSKEDFRLGRTYTLDEMDAYLDQAAARRDRHLRNEICKVLADICRRFATICQMGKMRARDLFRIN